MTRRGWPILVVMLIAPSAWGAVHEKDQPPRIDLQVDNESAREAPPTSPWIPPQRVFRPSARYESTIWGRGRFESVQVNVDAYGRNVRGDAANEPSLAVDPTDHNKMVIGWRQFNSIASDFREAGWAYSHDSGQTWTFPGTLTPGVFGSDPVLEPDVDGVFYYASITPGAGRIFKSFDGGVTWSAPYYFYDDGLPDKEWIVIDRTNSVGRNNIYLLWTDSPLVRSIDGGVTFEYQGSTGMDNEFWGTMAVGFDGSLYAANWYFGVVRSDNAMNGNDLGTFNEVTLPQLGSISMFTAPNPAGLVGQAWIATDHSFGPTRGNVYVLGSTIQYPYTDRTSRVRLSRSTDRAETWSPAVQVYPGNSWQWFGMMDVAPNGRIDALWNDTRNTGAVNLSELHYSFSMDGGATWSPAVAVSPVFDSWVGWPVGNKKLGDYYDLTSDARGVNVAYAATFNGEQDVYFLRIEQDCNFNDVPDHVEIAKGYAADCNDNLIPDECETFGDCTCDWIVTLADHAAFVDCLTGPASDQDRDRHRAVPHQHRDRHGAVSALDDRASARAESPRLDDRTSARVALEGRPNDRLENRSHTGARSPRLAGQNLLPPACDCADSHRDGAVDLADFARLQRFLTAP